MSPSFLAVSFTGRFVDAAVLVQFSFLVHHVLILSHAQGMLKLGLLESSRLLLRCLPV
jgi:hypothetical protein